MGILIQASQFIFSLLLLIILHELGHFIPAKIFKTKVEKFYLFFNPWFSLFKKKIGETEYGIGWLPLGGYVKIAGMIDESMDKEQMAQSLKSWEFRSKPASQRLVIMIGGVTVNMIMAIAIYAGIMMYYGERYLPNDSLKYGITADSTAETLGLRDGDKIISIDDKKIEKFSEIPLELLLSEKGKVMLERNGKVKEITIPSEKKKSLIKAQQSLIDIRVPYVVGGFTDSSVAKIAGLELGDSVVALNGERIIFFDEYLEKIPENKNNTISLTVYRAGIPRDFTFKVSSSGKIGVYSKPLSRFFELEAKKYTFFQSFPVGINKAFSVLGDYVRQIRLIVNPKTEAYKEVGGVIMIAKQFDTVWNWERFWAFTAFLSIVLAFLNILPIPALDGGHVIFVLWEMITGRKPSEKVLEYAQITGFVLLLGLIILANGNDIMRLFK